MSPRGTQAPDVSIYYCMHSYNKYSPYIVNNLWNLKDANTDF